MNEFHAMRAFAQVVDSGSFINASRTMNVAPAVVTRLVQDLERHLGARLLARTTRRMALTDIGRRYLERVRAILGAVEDAAAIAWQSQTQPSGTLRVRVPAAFATHQLTSRLPCFHLAHPLVTVELTVGGPVESIDQEQDVTIVVRQPGLDGGFVARRLARSEVVLCATAAYLDRHGRPAHPDELAEHDLLVPTVQRAFSMQRQRGAVGSSACDAATVLPRPCPLARMSPDLHQASALADLGIAGLPSFAVEQGLRDGRLERVLPDWRLPPLTIWACVSTRRHMPASTRAFLDFLVAEFGGRDRDPWLEPGRGAAVNDAPRQRVA